MSKQQDIDISIIIVNYNVKAFLSNLLHSIDRAKKDFSVEIIIVDNASVDDSKNYILHRHPDVTYIYNEDNIGFGRANNQGIEIANGKYTLIINPDTLISEDTLDTMFTHMENHPETAAAGCKLLNPDGSFAPESRRQIPTPSIAFWKMTGISKLFPKSKRFAGYYMNWLDEDEPSQVDVLSGSFMFYRTEVLKKLDGFDDRFFMYGEDIDLCYRTTQLGYNIDYVPQTSIIHYKGESTKKENIDYHITFNKANYIFFRKHFSVGYSFLFRLIIFTGIIFRGVFSYFKSQIKRSIHPIIDLFILNAIISIGFIMRYEIPVESILERYHIMYLAINAIASLLFIFLSKYYSLYAKNKESYLAILKTIVLTFFGVAVITFFVRDFAFSRIILASGLILSSTVMIALRIIRNRSLRKYKTNDKFSYSKVIIVGSGETTIKLIRKIRSKVDLNYEIIGVISQQSNERGEIENVKILGNIDKAADIIKFYEVDQILFLMPTVSYDEILKTLTQLRNPHLVCKIVPDSLDYIIGKTNVEYLDDLPMMDLEIPYQSIWNKFIKRNFDIILSLIVFPFLFVFTFPARIIHGSKLKSFELKDSKTNAISVHLYAPGENHRWKNVYQTVKQILTGKLSFVGAPLDPNHSTDMMYYKHGMTGLRQINESRVYREEEKQRYELYYLQNYSIWMDFEILFKTLMQPQNLFKDLH